MIVVVSNIQFAVKNLDIIEFYLYINNKDKEKIAEILEENRDINMITQELIKRGEKRGKIKGKIEAKIEDAKKMLALGFSVEDIIKVTELSKENLEKAGIKIN